MSKGKTRKVAIFACHDVTGMLVVNEIVSNLVALGITPVIFNTSLSRNRKFKTPTPPVVAFFNALLTDGVIVPILNKAKDQDCINFSYQGLAKKYGLEYHDIVDVNDSGTISKIENDPDIVGGLAVRFLQVFEDPIINLFHKRGFMWNLHSGLLPDYKGLLIPYRAIQNGEKTYGMTLHDLISGIDQGGIVGRVELPLDSRRAIFDMYLDLAPYGARMILRELVRFFNGEEITYSHQSTTRSVTYYTNPTSQEFRAFMLKGILFATPNEAIERLVSLFAKKGSALEDEMKLRLHAALGPSHGDAIPYEERRRRARG